MPFITVVRFSARWAQRRLSTLWKERKKPVAMTPMKRANKDRATISRRFFDFSGMSFGSEGEFTLCKDYFSILSLPSVDS
jgi:hypothetical protein